MKYATFFVAVLSLVLAPSFAFASYYPYQQQYGGSVTTPYWCGSYWSSYPCNTSYYPYNNYPYYYQQYQYGYSGSCGYYYVCPQQYQYSYYYPYQQYSYGYCPAGYYYYNNLCYPNSYQQPYPYTYYNNYYYQW